MNHLTITAGFEDLPGTYCRIDIQLEVPEDESSRAHVRVQIADTIVLNQYNIGIESLREFRDQLLSIRTGDEVRATLYDEDRSFTLYLDAWDPGRGVVMITGDMFIPLRIVGEEGENIPPYRDGLPDPVARSVRSGARFMLANGMVGGEEFGAFVNAVKDAVLMLSR